MVHSTAEDLASLSLPWEVTDPSAGMSCGNYSMLAAIVDAQASAGQSHAAGAPASAARSVERPHHRLQTLMKQLHEPLPGLNFGAAAKSAVTPELRAARVAAAEALGPVTEATVFEPQVNTGQMHPH